MTRAKKEGQVNMEHYDPACGYILGNQFNYPEYEQVFTIDLFFKRFFQGELPHYDLWVIGQGLSLVERKLLLKLQAICPSLNFSHHVFHLAETGALEIKAEEPQEGLIELQYFYAIGLWHYQAELYVLDELKPAVLMEGMDKLLKQGLLTDFPGHDVFLKNAHLLQIKRLLPLGLSIEIRLEKEPHPNSYYSTLKGKARFYQENCCVAEINLIVEVEKSKQSKRHVKHAIEKRFSGGVVGCC